MILKLLGVALVIMGCGGVGFRIATNHRQDENDLRQLIGALDYMGYELQYRLTPLPTLCKQAAKECSGRVGNVFLDLSMQMEAQNESDAGACMRAALEHNRGLSANTVESLTHLGRSIGRFDVEGQLKGLEFVRQECRRRLSNLESNRDIRLRSYQTLSLCAGAALAILFV